MESGLCHFKACIKCTGDLIPDEGDWRCWQCGHYYYTARTDPVEESGPESLEEVHPSEPLDHPSNHQSEPLPQEERPQRGRQMGYGARSAKNINAVVRAKETSDERWWERNLEIIKYLDQGLSVKEIATLVGRGERQIRVVRERLTDIRAAIVEQ